jgi:hypothetical protein
LFPGLALISLKLLPVFIGDVAPSYCTISNCGFEIKFEEGDFCTIIDVPSEE